MSALFSDFETTDNQSARAGNGGGLLTALADAMLSERAFLLAELAGMPHEEELVIANDLEIDHSYQRTRIRQAKVDDVAERFDPVRFKPLWVNRRRWDNNRLFVMDGQHRLLGIRQRGWGDQLVPCIVYDNLSYEIEAKIFDTQDSSSQLSQQERFRSHLSRREADETIIDGLVRRAGYQLNFTHGDQSEGRIPGVQALKWILGRYGSHVLGETLAVCSEAFGTDVGPKANFLKGMALFLSRHLGHGRFDRRRLVKTLQTKTMGLLVAEGADASRAMGCTTVEGTAFAIHKTYNHRMSKERGLPVWAFGRRSSR